SHARPGPRCDPRACALPRRTGLSSACTSPMATRLSYGPRTAVGSRSGFGHHGRTRTRGARAGRTRTRARRTGRPRLGEADAPGDQPAAGVEGDGDDDDEAADDVLEEGVELHDAHEVVEDGEDRHAADRAPDRAPPAH